MEPSPPVGVPNCRSQFAIFGFVWNLDCGKTKESVNCLFGFKKNVGKVICLYQTKKPINNYFSKKKELKERM